MQIKYLFKINRQKWDALVNLRGWKHPITELSRRTGFGKSYCSMAINGNVPLSQDFMLSMIKVAGASITNLNEWASLFEIAKSYEPKKGPESQNQAKYEGKVPYVENTVFGMVRVQDRAKNLERINMAQPIPAVDFYDDAMPKRFQVAHKYGR